MDVLISGATGLIGSALIPELEAKGHTVRRLTRHPRQEGDLRWDLEAGTIEGDLSGADAAREAGVRVVHPRFGIVLTTEGGALGKTLPIFKLGGGGKIGSGRQYWSWISLED